MNEEMLLQNCTLCPIECGVNRLTGVGACGVSGLHIAKYYLHPFEEPCISFQKGSGTIFFTGCNLRCTFCQNYEVSRAKRGKALTPRELTDVFKELEDMAQRLDAAVLLDEGENYQTISQKIGISTATISRVSKCLKYGSGYRYALDKMAKKKDC